jgi:hypothetical protein
MVVVETDWRRAWHHDAADTGIDRGFESRFLAIRPLKVLKIVVKAAIRDGTGPALQDRRLRLRKLPAPAVLRAWHTLITFESVAA